MASHDGLGAPVIATASYYVQDRRGCVGNCALWWAIDRAGYVCELDQAGVYTGVEVLAMDRPTDVPWPVDYVQARVTRHVRVDALRKEGGRG